jgi:hypothetical protein
MLQLLFIVSIIEVKVVPLINTEHAIFRMMEFASSGSLTWL